MQKFDKLLNYSFFTSDYHLLPAFNKMRSQTRLHSSRMRTARALTISPSMLCAGGSTRGVFTLGGCLLRGVSTPGGVYSGGVVSAPRVMSAPGGCLLPGGVWYPSMHWGGHPTCEQNHTRLWKHNLAPTSLRAVIKLLWKRLENR